MYISDKRWSKFRQELIPILFISCIQIWWSFRFFPIMRLGAPWNMILGTIGSVVGVAAILYQFSSEIKPVRLFNFDFLDEAPQPLGSILKNIGRVGLVLVFHLTMIFMWYVKLYNMPDMYYVIQYVYCMIYFTLLYRVRNRNLLE